MRLFHDDFTLWLQEQRRPIVKYQPAGFLGGPALGWKIAVGGSSFVYRIPEERPQVLIIVLFEKTKDRSGLRSPFFDFVRFLNLVKKSNAGITTIEGHIDALEGRPDDSLESNRIAAFYKKHLAASTCDFRNGLEWVAGDLTKYLSPLKGE